MFFYFAVVGAAMLALSLIGSVIVVARVRNEFTRVVVADLIFYSMIGLYLVWSMFNDTQIAYEIVLLAAITGGVLPTMSMARIVSKGRR